MNAFANVVNTACHKVIRGVILTRQGLESKARSTSMMQELVKLLPPDFVRTCLARVSKLLTLPSWGATGCSARVILRLRMQVQYACQATACRPLQALLG